METNENIKQVVDELAKKTGNNPEEADVKYNSGPNNDAVKISFGDEEYDCYETADAAFEAAKADIRSIIDELGGVMEAGFRWENIGGIESFVKEDDAEDVIKEYIYDRIEDLDDDEFAELKDEYNTDDIDVIVDGEVSKIDDYVGYIIDNFGEEELNILVKNGNIGFDIEKLVETVVNYDGMANSLAHYDGNEIVLDCDWYCYRTN